jgi:catechol 2,3-dioxygenase-like lactoylglutathione lyase family enzyme
MRRKEGSMTAHIHHIGIMTGNPREMVSFYNEKLGFQVGPTTRVPETLIAAIFGFSSPCSLTKLSFGRVIVEIISPDGEVLSENNAPAAGYNHWGFGVEDAEGFCRQLLERGVEVVRAERTGRFVNFIKDPDGNLIEVYKAREEG